MKKPTRRGFIAGTAGVIATSAGWSLSGSLAAQEHPHHGGAGHGLEFDAAVEKTCATCQYWGGMRKLSADKKMVTVQSMGWCNNPASPNHQKLTGADHQMTQPGIWQKWSLL